jgi:glutaredoxin 3
MRSLGTRESLCYTCRRHTITGYLISNQEKAEALSLIIYTKPGCPYCQKAREHYDQRGIIYDDRNAQDNHDYQREMLSITKGDPTVPVIVEDGRLKQIGWEGRG